MSKPTINYHYSFEWHGRPYYEYKAYPRGTPVDDVLKDVVTPGMFGLKFERNSWEPYAWPGGYEITYYTKDGGTLCHQCSNKELPRTLDLDDDQFYIVAADINYEDNDSYCDHCNRHILPAYGDAE